jgi:peptidyl-prolyl cis-trans isomerase C
MRQLKTSLLAVLALGGTLVFTACQADDASTNIAVVNGVPIPKERLDFVAKIQAAQGQQDTEETRRQLREALITREIITQEAVKKGLDQSPEYRTQMELAKQQLLVNAFLEDYLKSHEPTEADMMAEYERVKAQDFDPDAKEYKVRHIMVAKEAEAKAILAQLKQKGVKFEDLAKKKSMDNGSKNKGGELGWTDGSNLAKPFAEAMKSLKKGETTKTPVQTQYGWHIIRVDDIRDPTFPAYEEVKEQIARQLIAKQRDDLIDTLRKQATIE